MEPQTRKPTNLSLDQKLLADAKSLKINLSRAAEAGIRNAVAESKAKIWKRENRKALDSSNAFVKENGLPLSDLRQF